MSEAVAVFMACLSAAKQVERIQALAHPDDAGFGRVLERCGLTFEGILRKAHFDRGAYKDLAVCVVLRGVAKPLDEPLAPLGS
jgi:ribosomal-protein-alanine N-acetyltransferase